MRMIFSANRNSTSLDHALVSRAMAGLPANSTIYKICDTALWREAERVGVFRGAPIDVKDGFIHFSSAAQVAETAARHFSGADGLLLIAVDAVALGDKLVWEPSRGGDLFPH